MRPVAYLRALFAGHIGHWAQTNDVVVNEFFARIKNLDQLSTLLLRHFMYAANHLAEQSVGYQHVGTLTRLLTIELKDLRPEHFRSWYTLFLSYFVVVSYTLNPPLRKILLRSLFEVAANRELARDFIEASDRKARELGTGPSFLGTSYLEALVDLLWRQLAASFPGVVQDDVGGRVAFKIVLSSLAVSTMQLVRSSIDKVSDDE